MLFLFPYFILFGQMNMAFDFTSTSEMGWICEKVILSLTSHLSAMYYYDGRFWTNMNSKYKTFTVFVVPGSSYSENDIVLAFMYLHDDFCVWRLLYVCTVHCGYLVVQKQTTSFSRWTYITIHFFLGYYKAQNSQNEKADFRISQSVYGLFWVVFLQDVSTNFALC